MVARRWTAIAALVVLAGCAAAPAPAPIPPPAVVVDTIPPEVANPPAPPVIDTTPSPPPPPVRAALPVWLSFTGDINLGTTNLPGGIPPDDGRGLLARVDSLLTGDLVIGNFEGVLADTGASHKCDAPQDPRRRRQEPPPQRSNCYAFMTPSRLAPRLVEAGFTHLNLANNHANDMGLGARLASDSMLRSLGLRTYGPSGRISVDTIRRGDSLTIVGLIGFTTYPFAPNLLDIAASVRLVDSVVRLTDLVIVTFHGGAEGTGAQNVPRGAEFLGREPRGDLRAWSHAIIDAGADLVVGHGPHVLRGLEFYEGKLIAYSLGNFMTYRGFTLDGPLGLTAILQVELSGDGSYLAARIHPLVQEPQVGPHEDPSRSAIFLLQRLSLDDFGPAAARLGDDGAILPPAP
ncbi:MAG: CapA family protein [Gemmatimonadota bacterium]